MVSEKELGGVLKALENESQKRWVLGCDSSPDTIEIPVTPDVQVVFDKGRMVDRAKGYPRLYMEWTERVKKKEGRAKFEKILQTFRHFLNYYEGDEEKEKPSKKVPMVSVQGFEEMPSGREKRFFDYKGICKNAICSAPLLDGTYMTMTVSCEFFTVLDITTKEGASDEIDCNAGGVS